MTLKERLKYILCEVGQLPGIAPFIRLRGVRQVLEAVPGGKALYRIGWDRLHPFDRLHGIDASGGDRVDLELSNQPAFQHANPYGGSQPGPLRTVLAMLPDLQTYTFVDLGCGKGRPLFVATEFPFRRIIGVEFSPRFAAKAQENATVMAQRYPERTKVEVLVGDGGAYAFPPGDIVLFLYNPFGEEIHRRVVVQLEAAMAAERRSVFVVYYYPVFEQCYEASPALTRIFKRTFPYSRDELGFGPAEEDTIVLWRGGTAPVIPVQ